MSKRWYVINTYSGYEAKVKTNLENRIKSMNMEDKIFQILIPSEEVTETRNGKKRVTNKKFFPGYILVEMDMDENSWSVVRNTPKVTSFVGIRKHPHSLAGRGSHGDLGAYRQTTRAPGVEKPIRKG